MSSEKIKTLLAELREAIEEAPDAEARQLVEELDADIHEMLEHDFKDHDSASILEKVNELETRFAADHPALERFLRQIADWLAKMGV